MKSLPVPVARVVSAQRAQTSANPSMALNHAVALDKLLATMNWHSPVTYSSSAIALPGEQLCHVVEPLVDVSSDAIGRAHAEVMLGGSLRGISEAFQFAQGAQVRALNLLYANQSGSIETLWLHFVNKYLAYFAPASDLRAYALALAHSGRSRFHRLRPERAPREQVAPGPLISVLMPVFNAAETLRTAVASILAQTWWNLELLLIDDCSADASLNIAQELAAQDQRIRVVALSENGGPYIAKNIGLRLARGDYITVHDADDWAFPTRLADQIAPLLSDASGALKVSMGKTLRLDASGQFTRLQPPNWVTEDGAFRWCFPSPLFERQFFLDRLGAWDSVTIGADAEIIQRIRRFAPGTLKILDVPVMLQLDVEGSLTRADATHNDDRGESPMRAAYRQSWRRWHDCQAELPKLGFPLYRRPFVVPDGIQKHIRSSHAVSCRHPSDTDYARAKR